MQSNPSQAQRDSAREHDIPVHAAVESLLRQILECLGKDVARDNHHGAETAGREVVLDVYVDGVCYTLTRTLQHPLHPHVTLSPREKEIVRLVAKGLPSKGIADALHVSLWTVATHLRRIFAKLDVSSRAEMVAYALREGLLGGTM